MGEIQYYSKETLYQYKDQKNLDEWLEKISSLENTLQDKELELYLIKNPQLLQQISEYTTIAKTMGDISIREKQIDFEHQKKFKQLELLSSKISKLNLQLVDLDKEHSNQIITNTQNVMISISIISIIIAIGIGFVLSTSFAGRINDIVTGTRKISQGKLDEIIYVKGNDEIGKLCQNINFMIIFLSCFTLTWNYDYTKFPMTFQTIKFSFFRNFCFCLFIKFIN